MKKQIILGLLLWICILSFSYETFAQRIFVPSEEGILVELKEGKYKTKLLIKEPASSIQKDKILPNPFKLYIYSEDPIYEDELFIRQLMTLGKSPTPFYYENPIKAVDPVQGIKLNKISSYIYEVVLTGAFEWDEDLVQQIRSGKYYDNYAMYPSFVLFYNPNKQSKKIGKTKKRWFANLSEEDYNPRQIQNWTQEEAQLAVENLIQGKNEPLPLFASIKPLPQVVNGQQVQYIIVQNQPSSVIQDNNQEHTNEKKQVEIISDVDKNIPYRDINNENTFALIIANEDYNKVAPVNFALRDGQKINEYLKKTLGIEKSHIAFLENATLNDMRYEVNRLTKISDAYNGEASFIIYYIGHGIPDEKNGNGYLLPVDGYGNDVSTAYPLEELYTQLSGLDAKKIVLFTDACFSGANKSGDMLVAARGIAIRSNPNEAKGHLIAFSACQGDETAYSFDEQGHGLMTYYFLKKLKETGGKTTLGELEEYIVDNVGKTAIVINGKSQTPRVSVSPELQDSWREITLFE